MKLQTKLFFKLCKALPFFYAFSGCDTLSRFFKHSKATMWDSSMQYPNHNDLTRVFQELSEQPREISLTQVDIIEGFYKVCVLVENRPRKFRYWKNEPF